MDAGGMKEGCRSHQPPQLDGRGHQQPGYPQPSPDSGTHTASQSPKTSQTPLNSPF